MINNQEKKNNDLKLMQNLCKCYKSIKIVAMNYIPFNKIVK